MAKQAGQDGSFANLGFEGRRGLAADKFRGIERTGRGGPAAALHFSGIPVVVLPADIQHAFGGIARRWCARVSGNNSGSRALATLRDTLLLTLLSGNLTSADCEHTFARVA